MTKEDMEEKIWQKEKNVEDHYRGVIPGTILIVLGILFLLPRLGVDFGNLWPTFILAPGLAFIIFYFVNLKRAKIAEVLIPGMILTLLSVFFYYQTYSNWANVEKLWPIYPLIVGVAFYTFYLASDKEEKEILVPANILSAVGIVFLLLNYYSFNLWPIVLIITGLVFILTSAKKDKVR